MKATLLRVITLAHFSHSYESRGVLVGLVGVEIVQGGGVSRDLVASREIDTHGEVDLTASHYKVKEGV